MRPAHTCAIYRSSNLAYASRLCVIASHPPQRTFQFAAVLRPSQVLHRASRAPEAATWYDCGVIVPIRIDYLLPSSFHCACRHCLPSLPLLLLLLLRCQCRCRWRLFFVVVSRGFYKGLVFSAGAAFIDGLLQQWRLFYGSILCNLEAILLPLQVCVRTHSARRTCLKSNKTFPLFCYLTQLSQLQPPSLPLC